MAVSNVTDLYNLDALLTDEERIVRDTLREWVQDQVMPKIANAFETAHFPREWIKELADLGVFGANLGYRKHKATISQIRPQCKDPIVLISF